MILKIDLDLKDKLEVYKLLTHRLIFCIQIKLISLDKISKIELIKKNSYSVKIYIDEFYLNDSKDIIILQAVLGDDDKRVGINFRDYKLGFVNWNRLFDITKRNKDGSYINANKKDITKLILNRINKKNETKNKKDNKRKGV